MRGIVLLAVGVGMVTTSAAARDRLTNGPPRKPDDPNRVICQIQQVTGTRLAEEKRCLTAGQWYNLERDQRIALERVQAAKRYTGF